MQYARKRRFRKRISNRTIEAVEAEVDRLLKDDERAESTKFSLIDAAELAREGSTMASDGGGDEDGYDLLGSQTYDDEQDAEGEIEYDYPVAGLGEEVEDDTLAIDLESALMDGMEGVEFDNGTGALPGSNIPAEEESDDDDDEDEEETGELDEDAAEAAQEREKLRGEIQDLEEAIRAKTKELDNLGNPILRLRVEKVINSLQSELELKIMQSDGGQ
jgi:transcription initiation factor TFIID subunit 7